ncbi:MAG: DegV family protein, partial [Lactobacillus delbrueckii]
MENVRLIVDSSANTLTDPSRGLEVVPLTLT